MRRQMRYPFLLFLGLAFFGFFYKLIWETERLLYDILFLAVVLLAAWGVYTLWVRSKRKPIRYSKTQQKAPPFNLRNRTSKEKEQAQKFKRNKRMRPHSFTVIEGNKGNKGDKGSKGDNGEKKKPFSS